MQRKPNCSCFVCQKQIYRRPAQIASGRVFCSVQCSAKTQQKPKVCKICQQSYLGNKQTCSRSCANQVRNGMTYTRHGKHNKAYRGKLLKEKLAAERGGVCEVCDEENYAILQVHHNIERHAGDSDDLSNLQLLCPNCHATHHLGHYLYKLRKMI